jgi:hypothetical protein
MLRRAEFIGLPRAPKKTDLCQEHAVAVGEEAVAFADGVAVGGEDGFAAGFFVGEGADQHEEGGLGQVEVGEQAADDAEVVAGGDEDAGLAGVGFEGLARCDLSAVLKRAGSGGSGGYDAATFGECGVDGLGGGGGQGVVLGVEVDVGEVFGADGLEGA